MPDDKPPQHYCCGFLFKRDFSEVALIEKNRPAWQAGLMNGIGGHIKSDEIPIEAMVREFKEEAGVDVRGWMLFRVEWFNNSSGATVYFFAAVATDRVWAALHTAESEPIVRVRVPLDQKTLEHCIYNLGYLVPMASILLQQPIENIPHP